MFFFSHCFFSILIPMIFDTLEKSVACSVFLPVRNTKQEWEFSVGWTYRLLPRCAEWAAATQQFRPFRQSCEANPSHFSHHGKSWHWRDIWNSKLAHHGNTVWFRIHAWKSGKKLKHHESTNQREDLLVTTFLMPIWCPFDAVMWDELNEAGGVTYL